MELETIVVEFTVAGESYRLEQVPVGEFDDPEEEAVQAAVKHLNPGLIDAWPLLEDVPRASPGTRRKTPREVAVRWGITRLAYSVNGETHVMM